MSSKVVYFESLLCTHRGYRHWSGCDSLKLEYKTEVNTHPDICVGPHTNSQNGFSASNIYLVKLNKKRNLGLYQRVFQYSIQVGKQFEQTPKSILGIKIDSHFTLLGLGANLRAGAFKCLTFETLDVTNTLHCKYWMVQPLNTGGLIVGSSSVCPFQHFLSVCVCVRVNLLTITYLVQKQRNVMCKDFFISLLLKNDS